MHFYFEISNSFEEKNEIMRDLVIKLIMLIFSEPKDLEKTNVNGENLKFK